MRMSFRYCSLTCLGLVAVVCASCATVHPERAAVMETMRRFVDTMETRDVDGAAEILVPEGVFVSTRTGGEPGLRHFSNADYLAGLLKREIDVRERLYNETVLIDGDVALVWTEYDFFKSGELSHTGRDVFNLVRTEDGWKICGGAYTVIPSD